MKSWILDKWDWWIYKRAFNSLRRLCESKEVRDGRSFHNYSGRRGAQRTAQSHGQTDEWTMRAARGECAWVCSDCCMSFPDGIPDACAHGIQQCTNIIARDKGVNHE